MQTAPSRSGYSYPVLWRRGRRWRKRRHILSPEGEKAVIRGRGCTVVCHIQPVRGDILYHGFPSLDEAGMDYNFFYLAGIYGSGHMEEGVKNTAEVFNQLPATLPSVPCPSADAPPR